jgi:hypothetical protein
MKKDDIQDSRAPERVQYVYTVFPAVRAGGFIRAHRRSFLRTFVFKYRL